MKNILIVLFLIISFNAYSKVNVITSTPDLAWVVKQLGGEQVEVESLLTGHEDPHFVDAVPLYIQKAANAQMVVFIGLELEVGWLPKVLTKTGKKDLQTNGKGHCDASKGVQVLEKMDGKVDRGMGHVHAAGNPHYHLSTKAMINVVQVVANCFEKLEVNVEANKEQVIKSLTETSELVKNILKDVAPHIRSLEYHKEFTYFLDEYRIKNFGSLEVIPGSLPSAGQLAEVVKDAKKDRINLVLATPNSPDKILNRFESETKIKVLKLPLGIIWERGTILPDNAYQQLLISMAEKIKNAIKPNVNSVLN